MPRLRSVGRIEIDDDSIKWAPGTAWMIGDDLAITNRHVADHFATHDRQGRPTLLRNFRNRPYEVHVDFLEEHNVAEEHEVRVVEVLYLPPRRTDVSDIAVLRLESSQTLPPPIPLRAESLSIDGWVAVIGYPQPDPRIPASGREAEHLYFQNIYGVKRLAPGQITSRPGSIGQPWIQAHNATTLGGNSGSVLLDLATGSAAGLHFRGEFKVANYAVTAEEIRRVLGEVDAQPTIFVPPVPASEGDEDPEVDGGGDEAADALADRGGYDPTFIDTSDANDAGDVFTIPLPEVTGSAPGSVLELIAGGHELKYRNFSVVMNKPRRLCYFSAVNIDGLRTFSIRGRRPGWRTDKRIEKDDQIIRECYGAQSAGKFSRGHMTRREDPNWGDSREEAVISNRDTFFVTNACPQFQPFNAGIWLRLEEFALEHADQDDMRIAVFTGPVFDDTNDPNYFDVLIPVEYWKILAFKHDETGELSATGYLMSQEAVLPSQDEFVFGQFRNSQVTVRHIEKLTGLSFHHLRGHDPFDDGSESIPVRPLNSASDIVFS
ncbi:MAG: DNA/RNA non-specific endonuclease [Acidobacteriota bacterium]